MERIKIVWRSRFNFAWEFLLLMETKFQTWMISFWTFVVKGRPCFWEGKQNPRQLRQEKREKREWVYHYICACTEVGDLHSLHNYREIITLQPCPLNYYPLTPSFLSFFFPSLSISQSYNACIYDICNMNYLLFYQRTIYFCCFTFTNLFNEEQMW